MEVKHPRTATFVKQANIAGGHQQVNNGNEAPMSGAAEKSRAREKQMYSNELLEDKGDEGLDFGASQAAIADDQALETVGKVNGAEDAGGKSGLLPQQSQVRSIQ